MNRLRGDPPASPQTDAQGDASADAEGYLLESVELLSFFFARALKKLGNGAKISLNSKSASNIFENDAVIYYIYIYYMFFWLKWPLVNFGTVADSYTSGDSCILFKREGHASQSQIQHSNLENDDISNLPWVFVNHKTIHQSSPFFMGFIDHPENGKTMIHRFIMT